MLTDPPQTARRVINNSFYQTKILMKNLLRLRSLLPLLFLVCALLVTSCDKDKSPATPAPTYSDQVVTSWLTLQLKLTLTAPGGPIASPRRYAYTGIALYESIVPGFPAYQSITPQLNGLSALPTVASGTNYYWPACANAAMAAMIRNVYPTTSAANKLSIDSLEAANIAQYQKDRPVDELTQSAEFGKQVAAAVFAWAKTDGSVNTTSYTPPVGDGLWVPTPPAFGPCIFPYWGQCRPIVANSGVGAAQGAPISYSTDPASAYYAQAKEVYDISQALTPEQRTIALFWNSNSWNNILSQLLAVEKPPLEVAAVAYTQMSIAMADASISLFKDKYLYNCVRPITYIRSVLSQPTWNAVLVTPPHPEYPSGHAIISSAAAETLTLLFGDNHQFSNQLYGAAGFSPRSYASFEAAAREAANSRVYGGIHYSKTADAGLMQGKIIAHNVAQNLKFKR